MLKVKREDSIAHVQIILESEPRVSTNSTTIAALTKDLCYLTALILATVLVSHLNLSLIYSRYKVKGRYGKYFEIHPAP